MGNKKRTSEWNRFRPAYAPVKVRSEIKSLGDDKPTPPGETTKRRQIIEEYRAKEIALRNSCAPSSVGERHYPQQFTIKKVEE